MSYWRKYELLSVSRSKIPKAPGVYVIYFDDKPVYVGQSGNLASRFADHNIRWGYGRNIHTPWMIIPDDIEVTVKVKVSRRLGDWAMWEIRLISRLAPQFNVHHLRRRAANA